MIRFTLISILLLGAKYSQEVDSLVVNNVDSSSVSIRGADSLKTDISILPLSDSTSIDSTAMSETIVEDNSTLDSEQPLPIILSLIHI